MADPDPRGPVSPCDAPRSSAFDPGAPADAEALIRRILTVTHRAADLKPRLQDVVAAVKAFMG